MHFKGKICKSLLIKPKRKTCSIEKENKTGNLQLNYIKKESERKGECICIPEAKLAE